MDLNWARLRKGLIVAVISQVLAEIIRSRREAAAS